MTTITDARTSLMTDPVAQEQIFPAWARIAICPDEVCILDFGAGRFPSAWSTDRRPQPGAVGRCP